MVQLHFLVVSFPAQGHINPSLQFAKRLIRIGVHVTFVTSVSAHRRMTNTPTLEGLTRRWLTCIVYNFLLTWVPELARDLHVRSALVWIQPVAVLDIYYYYFNGYDDVIDRNNNDPSFCLELPGLPFLTCIDLPSFLIPSINTRLPFKSLFRELIQNLEKETKARVLVNSFEALEAEALRSIDKFNMAAIGPLIHTSFGGDLISSSMDYMDWLNSKPEASVVYVSFGTTSALSKMQEREIDRGLLECRRPFLWVILENMEELKKYGMVVPWCSQVEVLCNSSIGCFVTHCGWNSTMEGLIAGVPMVTLPQWSDQTTNAKLIKDVWKTGLRLNLSEKGLVEGDELTRCVEMVMEEENGEKMRKNAKR
ncbi:hypothetical protein NE237_011021 [Protea cynaroides]|uniref:Glycosyltransferase n=1 Tax=Protea cynaroides TaxID=273540 RepID=A0A9Q0GUW1_9MAGN|nr:hypothetical protein NE237_011021 [Protea cynaroides]